MNQQIQVTKLPSQRQLQQELPPEDGSIVQAHTSQDEQQQAAQVRHGAVHHRRSGKLTVLPLIFLIYFEVAGGPYGSERAVRAAGSLFTLLGFLIFPFAWGVPESLVTAELSAALPGNGGFVRWADLAFGPLAGSLLGTWKYLSCVINIAAYPALVADYLGRVIPAVAGAGRTLTGTVLGMTVFPSLVNYTGLTIVGWGAVALGLVSLAPFVLMTGIAVPKMRPRRWTVQVESRKDWRLFFNTLFWNLNYRDSASTMAGEVERPERTFPQALAVAVVFIAASYLLPLMAATGATDAPRGGRVHRCQLPAAAHGSDRRHGRAAGHVGERLPGRCCRHHRRPIAQVLDRGRRGAFVRGHVRGPAEQGRVPAAGHGGAGPAARRVRAPRHPVPHPVGGHRRLHGRHARRLLPQLRRRRGDGQLPLQPGHAAGVRGVPVAARQAARPEAALPRPAVVAAGAGRHVRRAVGFPGVRVRGGRVEGVRARRRADGARRRTARRHEAVQVQEVAQVQNRRGCRRGGRSPTGRGSCRRFCWRPSLNE